MADNEGADILRFGVDGLEFDRGTGELGFGILEVGVDGLEFDDGLGLSIEEPGGVERTPDGVVDLERLGREDDVDGLPTDGERVMGDEGLM